MISKLKTLCKKLYYEEINNGTGNYELLPEAGFKEAFKIIDEHLTQELNKLEQYPFMGERIMALKIYKAKIANILVEMEKNYE